MAKRGVMTDKIEAILGSFLPDGTGFDDPDTDLLRLIPYLMYSLINEEPLDPSKLKGQDIFWLNDMLSKNLVTSLKPRIMVTKPFFDLMNRVLWLGYVDFANQPD